MLLIGPPGIGKTAIMEQIAGSLQIGLVAYTITHHTRQSAIGLPVIEKRLFDGKEYTVTEYTMSEIVASVYRCMEQTGCREGSFLLMRSTVSQRRLRPPCCSFFSVRHSEVIRYRKAG
ncbi:MAG: AAA family ATPase [Blautia marasmi]